MKREREITKKQIKKKLDKICSDIVRGRGKCVKCGNKEKKKLQCAHIFSRRNLNVRWDLLNMLCMCVGCHLFWAHKEPIEFTEFVQSYLGPENYDLLKRKAKEVKQWELDELIALYNDLVKLYNQKVSQC